MSILLHYISILLYGIDYIIIPMYGYMTVIVCGCISV